ncbi:hypothetical protein FNJ57_11355 [Lactococcus lactis]|uniref:YfbU family protein n=1 Tax=Lactococcus lactis TaxID=1358 RepID=UPI001179B2A4|nr:YfbU family protein [Lactococcus lactis]TRW62972.1 hypothetical protein FNJ56_06960 [Lactococcus lactis]TRW66448.1 hypothetical protein FNJ57_11355 [Lactococcus lactis]
MELELSMKERLNLINQYKILLELADKDSLEKKEYENLIEILERGYTRYYSMAISEISEEELSDKECKAVVDILDLYSDLYFYWHNDDEIQNTIDKSKVLFKGFDGQNEVKYLDLYKFLLNDLDRFSDIKDLHESRILNEYDSHGFSPNLADLKMMVSRWKEIKSKETFEKLTLEDFKYILK